ncbi:MAG: DUF3875 domain-containing protein, partial [Sphingobacteriales bacterium]
MEKWIDDLLPLLGIEHDCILSKQGDITVGYKVGLPELFTLSDKDYEAFHQAWIKAIKILPKYSVFHKQDWFIDAKYEADFLKEDKSFLTRSSERFFNERPFLHHDCYLFLTKKPGGRKASTSLFSNLLRRSIVPEQTLSPQMLQDFLDSAGQFKHVLEDSGFIGLERLSSEKLVSDNNKAGVIEKYCFLLGAENELGIKDITFDGGIRIGGAYA